MKKSAHIKQQLERLLESQNFAVLATHNLAQPYASLVAFVACPDLKQVLFATTRSTRKYANLSADNRAAMLVDSRTNQDSDISQAVAVTATGRTDEVLPEEKEHLLQLYLKKHPHLKEFVHSPTCALLRLKVDTYYFVNRFQEVFELHINE